MKCPETKNNILQLLDDETGQVEKRKLEAHVADCSTCSFEMKNWVAMSKLLKQQPEVLPQAKFDNRMLKAFQAEANGNENQNDGAFVGFLGISKTALAFGALAILLATVFGFGLGRASISFTPSLPTIAETKTAIKINPSSKTRTQIEGRQEEKISSNEPEIRTLTKYIEVPVVKEKVTIKKIYISSKTPKKNVATLVKNRKMQKSADTKKIAEQFNLKDMEPLETLKYKIIRKGDEE